MDASSPPPDSQRELSELRARAYGPHPDIQADPDALARLTELEAARIASAPHGADTDIETPAAAADGAPAADSAWTAQGGDPPNSAASTPPLIASSVNTPRGLWGRLTASRAGRGSIVAGALVGVLSLAYTVAWLVGPHPDATLHATADEPDGAVFSLIAFLGGDSVRSTIRGYQPWRGVEPWFLVDTQGFHCFMLIQRPAAVDGANCVPPGVDLFADIGPSAGLVDAPQGLPDGSIVRFHYRGDSVDVFVYPPSETD